MVTVYPKDMKLGQMTNLNVIMWWFQFIDWLQFETRPSSLLNIGMAYVPKISTFWVDPVPLV